MKEYPIVSVIIPVFNGESYLAETVESVRNQTYEPIEILAIDNGSTDSSREILASYSDVRVLCQSQMGNANARNRGVREAKGEMLAFLDADDLWLPEKLQKHVEIMLENESILYTISHFKSFLSEGMSLPRWSRKETFLEGKPDYSPSSLVARKAVFEVNGYFNEDLHATSDVDWFFLANERKIPMRIIPEILHLRRVHDENQSNGAGIYKREMLSVIRESIRRKKAEKSTI